MECSNSGAVRDEELIAYSEGESVRPAALQHITQCPSCLAQANLYRRMELKLIHNLYRWDCPPNQVLGDYQFGLLSPQQANDVRSHLNMCVLCKAEVATLTQFLANDDPVLVSQSEGRPAVNAVRPKQEAKGFLENLRDTSLAGTRRIIATLVPQAPRVAHQRDTAPQTALWPRCYVAEDVNISVQVEREATSRDLLQVIGFVARKGTTLEMLNGTPVKLVKQTSNAFSEYAETIDDLGNFVFPGVEEGVYTLEISFAEGIVAIDQLQVTLQ